MSRTYGKAQDLIDFTRASSGTALRRVKYGAELVTNGTFDTDLSGWVTGSNVTSVYSSGTAQLTLGGALTSTALNWFWTEEVFEAGKVFIVTFDATYVSGGYLQGGYGYNEGIRVTSSGSYSFTVNPLVGSGTQTNRNMLTFGGDSGAVWKIDNVSVKEVTFDTSDGDLVLFNHPNNIPRIEYDANGNLLGLLVEESRTNLITYSESFDNSTYWTLLFSTLESGYSAPDGSNNAYLLTASSSSYYIYRSGAHVGLTTISMFMKAGTSNIGGLYSTGGISCLARFNLNTGTVDFTQDCTATITAVGNGWYRCSATYTNTSTGNMGFFMPNTTAGDSVYIFGFQSEAGAFQTSYVPSNSGSTTTRSADVASLSTSAFGYRQDEQTIFVEWSSSYRPWSNYNRIFELGKAGGADQISLLGTQGTNNTYATITNGGVTQLTYGDTFFAAPTTDFYKTAMSFKENDFDMAYNTNLVYGDTVLTLPSKDQVEKLFIGADRNGSSARLTGHIKSLKYIPRRLTNDQLVELTS